MTTTRSSERITAGTIWTEAVDDEMGDDYGKAGRSDRGRRIQAENRFFREYEKRMPGLVVYCLASDWSVSSVVGIFEAIVVTGGDRHVLSIADSGYGECRHTVTGRHNSCADG